HAAPAGGEAEAGGAERAAAGMNGAIALVTGADNPHGIGRAVCHALAARGAVVACSVLPGSTAGEADLHAVPLDAHWAVNVRAPALLSCALARTHPRGTPGRIVNLISGQFLGPMPGELAYTASKGALQAFTVQLAAEVAPLGITVNAVGPGPNDTGWIDDALRAELLPKFPMGRIGRPGDAAALVAFLCSDEAGWITGQVVHAEGGFLRG